MRILVGLDVGTTRCKAAAFTPDGRALAVGESAGYPVHRAGTTEAEQAPDDLWAAARAALADLARALGRDAPIAAIGVCGTTPGHVFVDRVGNALPRCLIWQDGRAEAEAAWLDQTVGADRLARWLGVQLPKSGALPPARLVWFRRHRPAWLDGTYRMVQPKDFINLRLTGRLVTDRGSAIGVLHLATGALDPDYAALLGIDRALLPDAVEPFATIGALAPAVAAELGLPAGVPVVAGWVDAWASMLGTGLGEPGMAFDITGTAEVIGLTARDAPAEARGLLSVPLYGDLGIVYGVTNAGADLLKWFAEAFLPDRPIGEAIALMEAEAGAVAPGADGLLFLPYLYGERAPVWDETVRGAFFRVDRGHRRGHFARAVLEGLAHAVRQCLELAEAVGGVAAPALRVSGGGARGALLNQIKADVLGRPVDVLEVIETGALGAAMLGAIGVGLATGYADAVRSMARPDRRFAPVPERRDVHDRAYEHYRGLYPRLDGLR